jgi:hypothetical protein
MSAGVRFVVEQFNEIVRPDGGSLRLVAVEGPTLRVAYEPGVNEECESCVIGAEDLADMLREALRQHDPSIAQVVVES